MGMGSGTAESLVPSNVTLLRVPDAEKRDGRFVPQSKDKNYKLDTQVLAEQWERLKVKIIGTLDPKTDLISVRSIEPATASSGKKSAAKCNVREAKASPLETSKTVPPSIATGRKETTRGGGKNQALPSVKFPQLFLNKCMIPLDKQAKRPIMWQEVVGSGQK